MSFLIILQVRYCNYSRTPGASFAGGLWRLPGRRSWLVHRVPSQSSAMLMAEEADMVLVDLDWMGQDCSVCRIYRAEAKAYILLPCGSDVDPPRYM